MNQDSVQKCADLIHQSRHIGALTGAGISTSSGIPDFRGSKGLYITRQYDPDTVFDIHYFLKNPKPFYQFARDFIELEKSIQPSFAHHFLSELENKGKLDGIITQNIDSLHQMAGSKNVFEMHGSFWVSHCLKCDKEFAYEQMKAILSTEDIAHCSCGGIIKPDIVFFGENVKNLNESAALARQCDLFFVIGTSCVVFPAAMIPNYTSGDIIVINQGDVQLDSNNVVLTVDDDIDLFFKEVSKCLNV